MTDSGVDEGLGCRAGLLAGLALLGVALVMGGVGLTLILSETCVGVCERTGLAMFYAAAPSSALFGVVGGGLPIAWPVDAGIWLVVGVAATSWAARHHRPTWHSLAGIGVTALLYGMVLSQFVAVDRV